MLSFDPDKRISPKEICKLLGEQLNKQNPVVKETYRLNDIIKDIQKKIVEKKL